MTLVTTSTCVKGGNNLSLLHLNVILTSLSATITLTRVNYNARHVRDLSTKRVCQLKNST